MLITIAIPMFVSSHWQSAWFPPCSKSAARARGCCASACLRARKPPSGLVSAIGGIET